MENDPIALLQTQLIKANFLTQAEAKALDKEAREKVVLAMDFADKSPWPDLQSLEEDVFAPPSKNVE